MSKRETNAPEPAPLSDASDAELAQVVDDVLKSNRFVVETGQPVESTTDERFHATGRAATARREAEAPVVPKASEKGPPPKQLPDEWYVALEGKPVGPFTLKTLESFWEDGTIDPDVLCWRAGLANWKPVHQVEDLVQAFTRRPSTFESKSLESSGSWRPIGASVLERVRQQMVRPAQPQSPPPLPPPPSDLSEVVRSVVRELKPLVQPPPRAPVLAVGIAGGVVSGALVAAFFLVFKPLPAQAPAPPAIAVAALAPPIASAPAQPASPAAQRNDTKAPPVKAPPSASDKPVAAAPKKARSTPKDEFERTFGEGGEATTTPSRRPKLERSEIMTVVLAHKDDVSVCMREHASADPGGPELLEMRWNIEPDGSTSNVRCQTADLAGTPLADCVAQRIARWTFPAHAGPAETYTHAFSVTP